MGIFDLADSIIRAVIAPVEIIADVANAVVKPVADVAEEIAKDVHDTIKDITD